MYQIEIPYTPEYKSHSCIRRTPKIGEKCWEKVLIACIRHTKLVKKGIEKKLK